MLHTKNTSFLTGAAAFVAHAQAPPLHDVASGAVEGTEPPGDLAASDQCREALATVLVEDGLGEAAG